MAKLPRVAQKIFAGAAATDQTAVFGTMKTGSAEYTQDIKELMSNPAFLQGWKSAVEESFAPFMEESNSVQKIVTQQLAYILENGIPEWDSETTYYKGSIAKSFSDGVLRIYISIIDDNIGNEVTDNLSWENVFDSSIGYAFRNLSNSTAITNCITEIPQDIKLELNNGTLTLKAGSKVYVPNGAGKFDEVIIPSDISRTIVWNGPGFITCESNNSIDWANINYCFSGDAAPDNPNDGWLWYDTANNIIKRYNGSEWTTQKSLPIAILNSSTTQSEQSIDQIFNGFSYIGSTVFALPGVKGLIPNGRNEDGSLKNIEFVNNSVKTYTYTNSFNNWPVIFGPDRLYALSQFKIEDNPSRIPTSGQWFSYYSPKDNRIYQSNNGGDWFAAPGYIMGNETVSSGKITSFIPKTAFHAVDYNDYARELNSKQDIANLSQTIDDSTTKYPSNKGVVDYSSKRHQVVSALPANPDPNIFYYIKEN